MSSLYRHGLSQQWTAMVFYWRMLIVVLTSTNKLSCWRSFVISCSTITYDCVLAELVCGINHINAVVICAEYIKHTDFIRRQSCTNY